MDVAEATAMGLEWGRLWGDIITRCRDLESAGANSAAVTVQYHERVGWAATQMREAGVHPDSIAAFKAAAERERTAFEQLHELINGLSEKGTVQ